MSIKTALFLLASASTVVGCGVDRATLRHQSGSSTKAGEFSLDANSLNSLGISVTLGDGETVVSTDTTLIRLALLSSGKAVLGGTIRLFNRNPAIVCPVPVGGGGTVVQPGAAGGTTSGSGVVPAPGGTGGGTVVPPVCQPLKVIATFGPNRASNIFSITMKKFSTKFINISAPGFNSTNVTLATKAAATQSQNVNLIPAVTTTPAPAPGPVPKPVILKPDAAY